jgi:signal peptidase II
MNGSGSSAYAFSRSTLQVKMFSILARVARYKWLLAIAGVIFISDQLSKEWILRTLPPGAYFPPENIEVIPGFFHIVHLGNTGAAWGMFEGMSFWLGLLAIVALAAIFIFRRHLNLDLLPVQISFGLLAGGILGNLVDRLRHGYVVDFLDFHLGFYTWPAFNVADAGIVVGVGIYIAFSFFHPAAIGEAPPEAKTPRR